MPKLEIIEIENSYLNFFTPAMIIAIGLFLEVVILKTFSLLFNGFLLQFFRIEIDSFVLDAFFAIMQGVLISLITYYIFIPRFKVIDADYHPPQLKTLTYIFSIFSIIILFRNMAIFIYELGGDTVPFSVWPWFLGSFDQLRNPTFFFFFLIHQFIIIPISYELLYRRTLIPALEDRGLSPLNSVILSSFGFCLLILPQIQYIGSLFGILFWLFSTFLYGLATGIIYILTRNILFSCLYSTIYIMHRRIGEIGGYFQDPILLSIRFFLDLVILISGTLMLIIVIVRLLEKETSKNWVKILKTSSVPNIERGVLGFLILSSFLVGLELLIISVISTIAGGNLYTTIFLYLIFYLVAFSIPFWLTITSEFTLA